ncbi:MAG: hypothetical protein K6C40_08410 [Thermoguttaceae bacterium]|nr:hypothetical protein [Thermoguttaceae bacterium]
MEKKIEDSKPILNRTRRQLIIGAALTPVVMTLHSAKVFADGTLQEGISGPAPYSGAVRGSAGMESSGGTIETENALYTHICGPSSGTLADYYGRVGDYGSEPDELSDFLNWSESSTCRWQFNNTETGKIDWTRRYEAMIVAAIDDYITGLSTAINTLASATWQSQAAEDAYTEIRNSSVPRPKDWTNEPFTVVGSEGVRDYYYQLPNILKTIAQDVFTNLPVEDPNPSGGGTGGGGGGTGGG